MKKDGGRRSFNYIINPLSFSERMVVSMNPILSMFGNFQNFQNQLNNFQKQIGNADPQQMVQQLLNSGQMSQTQFNQIRDVANQIIGKRM